MLRLLFAKSFSDLWSSFFPAVMLNFYCVASIVGYFFLLPQIPADNFLLWQFLILLGFFVVGSFFALMYLQTLGNGTPGSWTRFLWPALFLGLAHTTVLAAGLVALPFYFSGGVNPTWLLGVLVAWMFLTWLLGFPLAFAQIPVQEKVQPLKALAQGFGLLIASPGEALLVWFLGTLFWITGAILVPGPAMAFTLTANLRVFLQRKRTWLEKATEDELYQKTPWKTLLSDYFEAAKNKSFKTTIFPWN